MDTEGIKPKTRNHGNCSDAGEETVSISAPAVGLFLVPTNALILTDPANFRVVGNPEAIRFDVVEMARSRFVWHRICDGRFAVLIASGL